MAKYSPFKMKGHSLPGPNQRKSPAKQKQATLKSVSDSLQNLPNPAADKAYQEYLKRNKEISDSTSTAQQKVFEKRAKDIQQNVSPKEFKKQVKEVSSPAKQGLRDPRKDYSDPKVREEEIRQNKAMIESRKKANPKSFEKDPWDVKPSDKDKNKNQGGLKVSDKVRKAKPSPAKCPLIAALPAITGAIGAVGAMKKKKEEQ